MRLLKIIRDEKRVTFTIETQGHLAVKELTETCHEVPLASFDEALMNLAPIAASWADLINDATVVVHALGIEYTKHGTRSVTIRFTRNLPVTGKVYKLKTPPVQIDDPATDEQTAKQASDKEAQAVQLLINETLRYIDGERQQLVLGMDTPVEEDNELPVDA